ncbi:MAG: NAD(P)H-dependent oxidoreductase subunit E [Bacilli bacterium]|jgi:NADH-quinone oxidoreductase subunit E/NADP-reducing hydrogenase subunit HndA
MAIIQEHAKKRIKEIVASHKDEPTPLLVVLSQIQQEFGYIPLEVQEIVSEEMGIPVAEIYGVVTFYSFFSLKPKGKFIIGVCLGTACYVKGGQNVIDKFCDILKIKPGETTPDGLFTVDALRCIGACAIAPAATINGKVYGNLSVNRVEKILQEYQGGAK